MKRVLITGATGFIGQHTVPVLQGMGYEIIPCSRKDNCDILKPQGMKELLTRKRPTHLLHLAWDVNDGYKTSHARNMQWTHQSVRLIEEFARQGGKRVMVAGTQRTPEVNDTPYGWWKNELNNHAAEVCRKEQVSYAYGRIFYLYGVGEKPERLVPHIINSLLDGMEPKVSDKSIDILNSKDVASALCHILDSNLQGSVDIGTGKAVAIPFIADEIRVILKVPLDYYREPCTDPGYPADTASLESIGWRPQYTLDEGLQETIEWWWRQRQ